MHNPRFQRKRKIDHRSKYTINFQITAEKLRVVDSKGKQIGIMSKEEALGLAENREEDLILIAPNAKPPVAKIIDFNKFLYQEEKKQKEAKKGIKKSIVKDIKLSLFIAHADLDRIIAKTKEFLSEGNQVRLNLTLKGREMRKQAMGIDLAKRFIEQLGEINVSKEPKLEGKILRAVVAKKK